MYLICFYQYFELKLGGLYEWSLYGFIDKFKAPFSSFLTIIHVTACWCNKGPLKWSFYNTISTNSIPIKSQYSTCFRVSALFVNCFASTSLAFFSSNRRLQILPVTSDHTKLTQASPHRVMQKLILFLQPVQRPLKD